MCAKSLKLLSLNVRGVSNFHKRQSIFTWCCRKKTDIILFQETHLTKETEKQWRNEWGGKIFICSHGSPNSGGVMVFLKNDLNCVIKSSILDLLGRFVKSENRVRGRIIYPGKYLCSK